MTTPKPSDPSLADGIALFNQGRYYDCHDVLEALWMEADPTEKPFYQGILQIAVGLYHLSNHNWQGAAILLGEGTNRLRPYEPSYLGVAVAPLVDCGWAWLSALQTLGRDRVAELAEVITQAHNAAHPIELAVATTAEPLVLPMPKIDPAP